MTLHVDFSRLETQMDHGILSSCAVSLAGVGGSASLIRNLARLGIRKLTLVDFDQVDPANVPTQGYGMDQVGISKAQALADDIRRINPATKVIVHECRLEELTDAQKVGFIAADLLLGVTDSIDANGLVNSWAVEYRKDALFGACYAGCIGTEITGSFPDVIDEGRGCHRCFTDPRYRFRDENPGAIEAPFFNRHVFIAELLNVQLGYLAAGLLHLRAGSTLSITKLAERFLRQPLLMTRIDPDFYAAPGEMFSDLADGYGALVSRHWHRDVPDDFVCPACRTPGA